MLRFIPAAVALGLAALPAAADEFTDTRRERAHGLPRRRHHRGARGSRLRAEAADRDEGGEPRQVPAGGPARLDPRGGRRGRERRDRWGCSAAAPPRRRPIGTGAEELTITLVANSPMVSGMAAMISGIAAIGGGKPIRIQRTEFTAGRSRTCRAWSTARCWSASAATPASRTRRRISRRWISRRLRSSEGLRSIWKAYGMRMECIWVVQASTPALSRRRRGWRARPRR